MRQVEKGSAWLSEKQRKWVLAQRILQRARPNAVIKEPYDPNGKWAFLNYIYKFVNLQPFDYFISLCIFANTVILAIPYLGMDDNTSAILETFNQVLLAIFTSEAILKVIGLGPKQYFGPPGQYHRLTWNKFDIVIVIGSLAGVLVSHQNGIIINVIRLFRIARIIRLIKKLDGLHLMFKTFIRSLPFIANIMTIVITVYFVYGIIGVSLMGDLTFQLDHPSKVNYWANFRDFPTALLTLFRISTLDEWPIFAHSCAGFQCEPGPGIVCGEGWYIAYFVSFILIQTYMILNLFLAILIENFTEFRNLNKREKDKEFELFQKAWNILDSTNKGRIKVKDLVDLLIAIKPPLGFPENISQKEAIREFKKMEDVYITNEYEIEFDNLLCGITIRSLNLDIKGSEHVAVGQSTSDGRTEMTVSDYYEKRYKEYQDFAKEKDILAELDPNILGEIFKGDSFFNLEDRPEMSSESSEDKPVDLEEMVTNSCDIKVEVESSTEDENAVELVVNSSKTSKGKHDINPKEEKEKSKVSKHSKAEVESVHEEEEKVVVSPRVHHTTFKDQERERRIKRKENKIKVRGKIKKMEMELLDLKREEYKMVMKAQRAKANSKKKGKKEGRLDETPHPPRSKNALETEQVSVQSDDD